jgi:hypothetical protein
MSRHSLQAAGRAAAPFLIALLTGTGGSAGEMPPTPPAAVAEVTLPVPLGLLVTAVAGWVAAERGVPIPTVLPAVVFAAGPRLAEIRREANGIGVPAREAGVETLALHDFRANTIVLPRGWNGDTPAEVSMLVHEMVHHFQNLEGERFACPAAREKAAFDTQSDWLARFGTDLDRAFGINPLFVLVATTCVF